MKENSELPDERLTELMRGLGIHMSMLSEAPAEFYLLGKTIFDLAKECEAELKELHTLLMP